MLLKKQDKIRKIVPISKTILSDQKNFLFLKRTVYWFDWNYVCTYRFKYRYSI